MAALVAVTNGGKDGSGHGKGWEVQGAVEARVARRFAMGGGNMKWLNGQAPPIFL